MANDGGPALKIAFYIEKFLTVRGGGAERSLAELMNEMCRRGHDVTLVLREPEARIDEAPFYDLHPAVRIRNLSRWAQARPEGADTPEACEGARSLISRIRRSLRKRLGATRLRAVLEELRPDLVVVFLVSNFPFVARAMGDLDIPLVLCHRNDPEAKMQELAAKGSRRLKGLDAAHARAALVAVQMEAYKENLPPEVQAKTAIIPNVSAASSVAPHYADAQRENLILSVGRLAPVKNHALLIAAFARIAPRHPDWRVEIYGDGPERAALQGLIDRAGLRERIHLRETISNIEAAYRRALVFAFPSLFEGFSRALTEAMAHALPSICLRDCTFCREVIMRSGGGLLVENDVEDYAAALENLLLDPRLRYEMGAKGCTYMRAFTPDAIYDAWEAAFNTARHKRG